MTLSLAAAVTVVTGLCAFGNDEIRAATVVVAALTAALAWLLQSRRQSGRRQVVTVVVSIGVLFAFLGELLLAVTEAIDGSPLDYPAMPDGLNLLFYPLLALGLALLGRLQDPRPGWGNLIDTGVVVIGASTVLWQFAITPVTSNGSGWLPARLVSIAHPALSLLVLAMLAHIAIGNRNRCRSMWLLLAGIGVLLTAEVIYLPTFAGSRPHGGVDDLSAALCFVFLTAAALDPDFDRLFDHTGRQAALNWRRLFLLLGATMVAPTVAFTSDDMASAPVTASALMFLLVIIRMGGLLRTIERSGERRFQSLVQHSSDFLFVLEPSGHVTYASPASRRMLGLQVDGEDDPSLVEFVHPDDQPHLLELLDLNIESSPKDTVHSELRLRFVDHTYRIVALTLTNLLDDPDIDGVVVNGHDIHELRTMASFDGLTGLANRTRFTQRVEAAVAEPGALAVLLFDLDGFKEINDSLGHAAGDHVLIEVAGRLHDVFDRAAVVSRLGGDEFAVLLDSSWTPLQAYGIGVVEHLAGLAIESLHQPIGLEAMTVGVGASVGIVWRRDDHDSAEALLRDADIAMYAAKAAGKGRAICFEAEMGVRASNRLELRSQLEQALAANQLELHYQPLFRLADDRLTGFEALLRWNHPDEGLITPEHIIEAAEESNLIKVLGRWVIDAAISQLASWPADVGGDEPLSMSINLSPRQLLDPNLVGDLWQTINSHRIDPGRIIIEVTEGALVHDASSASDALAAVRRLGVHLAIDDYGSGNASINYLRSFPVDRLKIDRSLVSDLDADDGSSRALVASIVELARVLGMQTVAEGIETVQQLSALRQVGCDLVQGFLLARPLTSTEVVEFLGAIRFQWAQPVS